MRFGRHLAFGLILVMLSLGAALAQNTDTARVFGSANCKQKFECYDANSSEISSIAADCSVRGLGISPQEGLFDNAAMDGDNCMTTDLSSSGRPAVSQCCIIPDGNTCSMQCKLLVY